MVKIVLPSVRFLANKISVWEVCHIKEIGILEDPGLTM